MPICMLLLSFSLSAQTVEPEICNYAVKVNATAFYFKDILIQYIHRLNIHWTVLKGRGYQWGGQIPKVMGLGKVVVTSSSSGWRGHHFNPELSYFFFNITSFRYARGIGDIF